MKRIMAAIGFSMLFLAQPAVATKVKVGKLAPDATLNLVNGQKVTLSSLRGQVVVLNFWATWCVPCRTELPTIDAYYRAQRRFGLRIFAVTTEDSVPLSAMTNLFSVMAIEPVKRVRGPYAEADAVPTNIIIDRTGVVRYFAAGAFSLDDLNNLLVPLLREPVPAQTASAKN
jgi:cytochrome c biogenesis protein CcmG/thiol:disulfide interchange protein DsbE